VREQVTLQMIYDEVKRVNQRLNLIEGIIEEVITKALPEAQLSKQKINEIKKSIKEMKRGNYVTLEEPNSSPPRTQFLHSK